MYIFIVICPTSIRKNMHFSTTRIGKTNIYKYIYNTQSFIFFKHSSLYIYIYNMYIYTHIYIYTLIYIYIFTVRQTRYTN